MLLVQSRWRTGTRLAHAAIQLYTIAVAVVMLTGPSLINSVTLEGSGKGVETLNTIMSILSEQFRWIFLLIIAVSAFEAGKSIYRAVKDGELASGLRRM